MYSELRFALETKNLLDITTIELINEDIIEAKDSLVSEINKLSKTLNTLSTKVDWISSRVKDLEDKNNGLEIM